MKRAFSQTDISVTLTGEEWFVILTILTNKLPPGQFSEKGLQVWVNARRKFIKQIEAAQKETLP